MFIYFSFWNINIWNLSVNLCIIRYLHKFWSNWSKFVFDFNILLKLFQLMNKSGKKIKKKLSRFFHFNQLSIMNFFKLEMNSLWGVLVSPTRPTDTHETTRKKKQDFKNAIHYLFNYLIKVLCKRSKSFSMLVILTNMRHT